MVFYAVYLHLFQANLISLCNTILCVCVPVFSIETNLNSLFPFQI